MQPEQLSVGTHPKVEKAADALNGARVMLSQYRKDYADATSKAAEETKKAQAAAVAASRGDMTPQEGRRGSCSASGGDCTEA